MLRIDYIDSKSCLEKLANAKFSLNIMPCFHAGAHDRIFNSMLCGAVCVTDTNPYLDEMLTDGENALLYDVTEPERLAERLKQLLPEKRCIQDCPERICVCCCFPYMGMQDKATGTTTG